MNELLSYDPVIFEEKDFKELDGTNYKLHPLCDTEGGI
jgi:hypothetical protein